MGEATEVMRRKIAAFNAHDAKGTLEVFSPDCTKEVPGARLQGADQVVGYFSILWEAFPDMEVTVTHVVEDGPLVAIHGFTTGTHQGILRAPTADVPPTGHRVELPVSDLYEVRDGRIVASYLTWDQLTLIQQLGLAPAPTPA